MGKKKKPPSVHQKWRRAITKWLKTQRHKLDHIDFHIRMNREEVVLLQRETKDMQAMRKHHLALLRAQERELKRKS